MSVSSARNSFSVRLFGLLVLAFCLASCAEKPAPPADDKSAKVVGLFEHFDEGKQPGAAVVVIKDGRVILSRGFGYAHLENDTRIDENSSFRIGSLSKQFTTMALMVLAEDGKLNYDDLLSSHVPELHFWPGVTIRHLMNHTSGIPDYYEEEYYENFDANNPMPQNSDIIKIMSLYPEADFAPGEQYVYNNAAYEVLVTVVERASGELFADFLKQRVFMPANMTTATTFNSSTPDIPNRVYGYDPTETGFELNDYDLFNDMLGAGSVYLTLKDLAAWDRSLDANSVVSDATLDQAYTSAQLNNGDAIGYGFGWEVGATRGHRRLAHTGSWVGFRTAIARFPDDNLTIAVLSNRGDGNPSAYVEKISDIYLSGRGTTYVPDESQTAVMNHHRKIPAEDHWWNVRGDEMGWMHRHVEQMFPTVTIYRNGPVRELEYEPRAEIAAVSIDTPDGPMPFGSFIQSDYSTAMGVVILHKGRIVFESYPRMQEYEKPAYWSVSKVFAGAIVRILEERGQIDVSKSIEFYIPALATSAFAGVTVRNVLDMATGVDCGENYEDVNSCYYQYSMAIGDNLRIPGAADNPYDFLATVDAKRNEEQGEKFVYSGATNFLLMWLIEEVTGYPFQDSITKEFWYRIGAENDAAFFAYRYGIAVSHGGLLAKMRDLARFGLLYTPSYPVVSDTQIISDEHLDLIFNGGNPQLLRNAGFPEDGPYRHNTYMWEEVFKNGFLKHGGWGGQGLIIHPEKDVVAVFTSYVKQDYSEVSLDAALMKVLEKTFLDTE